MSTAPPDSSGTITADVQLAVAGRKLQARVSIPLAPIPTNGLLPVARVLTEAAVNAAADDALARGEHISCKKGCGACCRQLVPITPTEARQIRDLVEALPEPRRSEVRARFAAARDTLQRAGLLEMLLAPEQWPVDRSEELGLKYFFLGIACPFLEEESCSIHPERPLACREYLVTSPAEDCARPSRDKVRCLKLPFKVSGALASVGEASPPERLRPWVPLIIAPQWSEANPDRTPGRPGPELFRRFFEEITSKSIPEPAQMV
jgi:Fe-S-cluster containining protein